MGFGFVSMPVPLCHLVRRHLHPEWINDPKKNQGYNQQIKSTARQSKHQFGVSNYRNSLMHWKSKFSDQPPGRNDSRIALLNCSLPFPLSFLHHNT
jgi:hypothetical protein